LTSITGAVKPKASIVAVCPLVGRRCSRPGVADRGFRSVPVKQISVGSRVHLHVSPARGIVRKSVVIRGSGEEGADPCCGYCRRRCCTDRGRGTVVDVKRAAGNRNVNVSVLMSCIAFHHERYFYLQVVVGALVRPCPAESTRRSRCPPSRA